MLDFSPEKMFFIFLIVLIVLGPEKLPEISRKVGQAMGELRKLSGGFREEMNQAMHEVTSDSTGTDKRESTTKEVPSGSSSAGTTDDSNGS